VPSILIVGGGAFGRALAAVATRHGTRAAVWSRREELELPVGARAVKTLGEGAAEASLIFFCVPASHARPVLHQLGDVVTGSHLLIHVGRGLEPPGTTISQIVREETPIRRVGVMAGPLVPEELAASIPSAIVVASRFPEVIAAAQGALSQPDLRVYGSDDLTGVELSAALMTVLSLIAGVVTGLGGGVSTRALIVARGIAQSARVLEAMGAKVRTLSGLGGVGEVFVTAQGVTSPDYDLGLAIAKGQSYEEARSSVGRSSEAPSVAACIAEIAAKKKVRAPIFRAAHEILEGKRKPEEALREFFVAAPTEI
jgi:glycerol-3-phosphate dehydrogenase (NAD(P)+)